MSVASMKPRIKSANCPIQPVFGLELLRFDSENVLERSRVPLGHIPINRHPGSQFAPNL